MSRLLILVFRNEVEISSSLRMLLMMTTTLQPLSILPRMTTGTQLILILNQNNTPKTMEP
jgi:hypothetical protein